MPFEVRVDGQMIARCESGEEAAGLLREMLADEPDSEPEVVDLTTGEPAVPGGTTPDRDNLANKIGY